MVCPLCGDKFVSIKKHYEKHKDEVTFNEFLAKLYGYPEVPKCPHCGNECKFGWADKRFYHTCENPECMKKHRGEVMKKRWESEEFRERQSEIRVENWKNPEIREKRLSSMKETSQTQEYRNKLSIGVRRALQNPEYHRKLSESSISHWKSEEYRDKFYNSQSKRWKEIRNNPDSIMELYLIKCEDMIKGGIVVKCGISRKSKSRIDMLSKMGYKFIYGEYYSGKNFDIRDLEKRVHEKGFKTVEMDLRKTTMFTNGCTEWYSEGEYNKIHDFLTAELGIQMSAL